VRHRLQDERASVTHKFSIAGHEGYITVGLYPNGQPGEIFIKMAKEGSTVSGLMDSFATSISIALQHGVPLKVLCEKFAHTRFEPSGWTGNEQIGYAKSLMDYIFRWINLRFLSGTQLSLFSGFAPLAPQLPASPSLLAEPGQEEDAVTSPHLARAAEEVARRLNNLVSPQAAGLEGSPAEHAGIAEAETGPYLVSSLNAEATGAPDANPPQGVYHAADAMRDMYEMGDAPSCSTCGAIMVRNGSCYRCMSCGSTSGCS
jgi:ribonucleoside-diphosphate reductase alpha chain